MKCAAVMMQYDYGEKSRGFSYEYYNIFMPLMDVAGEYNIMLFDFYDEYKRSGKSVMNKKLLEFASYTDNLEEVFENREQIEISRFYERLPKASSIATQEFVDKNVYHRNPNKEEV